jgi:penicillin-insensitive murein DD-endopeptidase
VPLRRLTLVALLVAPSAFAAPSRTAKLEPPARRAMPGLSLGSPTEGRLVGGAHLAESPYVRIVPVYAGGDARWGLEPLIEMIDHAARSVRKQFPDSVLSVGHLSRPGGGEIDRHASHESGRDADVGFYVVNQQHKPIYAEHFVAFKGDGTAPSWPGAQFDDARNWAFVSAIATDPRARVSHIFVALPLRARLLAYAEKIGAPLPVRVRASELMAQPHGSLPHDDHFHVRISCPAGMDKCIEQPLARKRSRSHGALAQAGKAHSHQVAGHAHPPPRPERHADAKPERKDESVPSLAPIVPGLDSVLIPAPLTIPTFESPPIDDPDGVLDHP